MDMIQNARGQLLFTTVSGLSLHHTTQNKKLRQLLKSLHFVCKSAMIEMNYERR